jgi:hypothetical protein
MQYKSRRHLTVAAIGLALGAVAVALLLSLATRDLYLPVLPYSGSGIGWLLFFAGPVGAIAVLSKRAAYSGRFTLGVAALTAVVIVLLSYAVWIGWIVVECGLMDNRCFD